MEDRIINFNVDEYIENYFKTRAMKGKPVPLSVGTGYLNQIQHSSNSFRGFSSDELYALQDAAPILSFPAGHVVVKQSEPSFCVIFVLEGEARVFREEKAQEKWSFIARKGDWIGAGPFFESPPEGEFLHEPATVKLLARVNMLMMFTFKKIALLNELDPHCGHHLIRVIGEAAAEHARVPPGSFPSPLVPEKIQVPSEVKKLLEPIKDTLLFTGMTAEDQDELLEYAQLLEFRGGKQVLWGKSPCTLILVCIQGGLERAGQCGLKFANAGYIWGEAMLPYRAYPHDAWACSKTSFLCWNMETIYEMNKKLPMLAFKFIKNLMCSSIMKLRHNFGSAGKSLRVELDLKEGDLTTMLEELQHLRLIAKEGLPRLVKIGERLVRDANIYEERGIQGDRVLRGAEALQRLTQILEVLEHKLITQKKHILRKETETESEIRHAMKVRDNRIEALEYQIRQLEAVRVEQEEKYAQLEEKTLELQSALADQCQTTQEVRGELDDHIEDTRTDWQLMRDQLAKIRREGLPDRLKIEALTTLILQGPQPITAEDIKAKIERAEKKEIRMERVAKVSMTLPTEAKDLVPHLRRLVTQQCQMRLISRWIMMTIFLRQRHLKRVVSWEVMGVVVHLRGQLKRMKVMSRPRVDIQELAQQDTGEDPSMEQLLQVLTGGGAMGGSGAEDMEDTAAGTSQAAPSEDFTGEWDVQEMKTVQVKLTRAEKELAQSKEEHKKMHREWTKAKMTAVLANEDMDQSLRLLNWLVKRVLDFECDPTSFFLTPIVWTRKEVNLACACWQVLRRRQYTTPDTMNLDMEAIGDILVSRGNAELQFKNNPRDPILYDKDADGLPELVSPKRRPKKIGVADLVIPAARMAERSELAQKILQSTRPDPLEIPDEVEADESGSPPHFLPTLQGLSGLHTSPSRPGTPTQIETTRSERSSTQDIKPTDSVDDITSKLRARYLQVEEVSANNSQRSPNKGSVSEAAANIRKKVAMTRSSSSTSLDGLLNKRLGSFIKRSVSPSGDGATRRDSASQSTSKTRFAGFTENSPTRSRPVAGKRVSTLVNATFESFMKR